MQCKRGITADRTKIAEQGQSGVEGKQVTNMKIYKSKNRDRSLNNTEDQSVSMSHGMLYMLYFNCVASKDPQSIWKEVESIVSTV